jgi:hypothetical protein
MKSGKLIVFALLGLAVLGYAVFELAGGSRSEVKSRDAYAQPDRAAGGEARGERRARPAQRGEEPGAGPAKKTNVVVPVSAEPPPPPPPPIPLDEARKQYQDYMAELQAVKDEGRILSNEEWTEFYRRGNEVVDPLARALDSSKPDQVQELDDSHRRFRELIMGMEPSTAAAQAGSPPGSAPTPE